MKKNCIAGARVCSLALLALPLAGCFSHTSPYDYVENWLVREDPVRTFVIHADVIYVQSELYTKLADVQKMQDHVRLEVGKDKFSGLARVFSPLVASPEDLEEALKWYFRYHHKENRSFIFIGEGEGGALLRDYEATTATNTRGVSSRRRWSRRFGRPSRARGSGKSGARTCRTACLRIDLSRVG